MEDGWRPARAAEFFNVSWRTAAKWARRRDAGADHADLAARGVDVDPEVMRWPGVPPIFSFRDPDQNILYVVESS